VGPPRDIDNGPRRPAELLDQLRERLDRLADNHPSARRESAGRREQGLAEEEIGLAGNSEFADAGEPADAGEFADAGELAGEANSPELERTGYPGQEIGGRPGWLEPGWTEPGWLEPGWLEPGLPGGAADQYRPWFMSPEEGAPWFAEPGEAG
jgi:hypothetical protein